MPLQELIYTSVTTLHEGEDKVQAILSASVRKNEIQSITGLLMFDGQRYIQILEGERDQVDRLYGEITKDPRHGQLEMLHTGSITQRAFQTWRMAYEAMPAGLLDQLAENRRHSEFWRQIKRDVYGWDSRRIKINYFTYRGARFAKMRWSVRRCIFSRRAVSDTFFPQSS